MRNLATDRSAGREWQYNPATQRNSCIKRCQGARGGCVVGSGMGSASRFKSGPGSSGACTSGITGSTGFVLGIFFGAGLTALFADLRATGLTSGSGAGGANAMDSTGASAGVNSITGRVTPISANGTFQTKQSSRPLGDTGLQCSDTEPSAVHAGSPE